MTFSLTAKKEVGSETTELTFGVLNGAAFSFKAGQYLRLTLPSGEHHDFSIASSPMETKTLSVLFRNSKSHFKQELSNLKIGSTVDIDGPFGTFTLPDEAKQPLVFVAGGIGITPFLSMLRLIAHQNLPFETTLLYANSNPKREVYMDELHSLEHAHENIVIKTKTGRVDAGFLHNNVAHMNEVLWYVAGPPAMVQDTRRTLLSAGVSEGNIRIEEFTGYTDTETDEKTPYEHRLQTPASVTQQDIADADLRALFDAIGSHAIISMTDARGDIIYANDRFIEISGYEREELIGQNHRILKSGFHPTEFYEDLWRTIASGKAWRGEIKNRAKNGTFYWVDTTIAPIFDELLGKPMRYVALRILITEHKDMEDKLRAHMLDAARSTLGLENTKKALMNILEDARVLEKNLESERDRVNTIILSIDEGIVVVDTTHTVTVINPKAAALLGTSIDDAKGRDLRDLATLYHQKQIVPNDERPSALAMRLNRPVTFDLTDNYFFFTATKHTFPVTITAAPLREGENVIGAVIVFRDVTDEKKLEEAKSGFVALASHQLRTPLTGIRWYTEMLTAGDAGPLNETQQKFIAQIYGGTTKLIDTVNMLLALARVEGGTLRIEPTPTNVHQLVKSVANELAPMVRDKKLTLTVGELPSEIPLIPLDQTALHETVLNYLTNAIRYTSVNGTIDVAFMPAKDVVTVSVKDNGIGIPKHQQAHIFEKFFRADNAMTTVTEGTGLGLNLVKSLVELWDGRVWFESEEGKGTTFYFTVPYKGMRLRREGKTLS